MVKALYVVAAVAIGFSLSLQPPINAAMARTLSSAMLAACISIAISLVAVVVVWLTWGHGAGNFAEIRALPWWVVLGGIIGVVFVAGSIVTAPPLGMALFFVCVVSGQLLGSTLADQLGAFGIPVQPVTTMKVVGLALVLAGAALVQSSKTG
jgi:transporter family-2 protein